MLDQELKMFIFHKGEVKVFVTPLRPTPCWTVQSWWTVAHEAPLPMEEYWSGSYSFLQGSLQSRN